jgi:hypothetical protein
MSEQIDPQEVSRDILFDKEALVASLENDERITALRQLLDEAEKRMLEDIARHMIVSKAEVDQRKIDYTRGYFAGARYWLGGRIQTAKTRISTADNTPDPMVDPRLKESDA